MPATNAGGEGAILRAYGKVEKSTREGETTKTWENSTITAADSSISSPKKVAGQSFCSIVRISPHDIFRRKY